MNSQRMYAVGLLVASLLFAGDPIEPGVLLRDGRIIEVPIGREAEMALVLGADVLPLVPLLQETEHRVYLPVVVTGSTQAASRRIPPRPIPEPQPTSEPSHLDEHWDKQWGAAVLRLPVMDNEPTGAIVAVLDTGWFYGMDEQPNVVPGWDFVDGDGDPASLIDHGPHVISIIGAPHDAAGIAGICPQCRILPVRVCNADGLCPQTAIVDGLRYAVLQGADIINMSFGAPWEMPYIESAIAEVPDDVVLVASAGNGGDSTPHYPASYDGVLAISATWRDGMELASFSSYGPLVDFAAPGFCIFGAVEEPGRYGYKSGTSMAAPHAAGVAGLVKSLHPEWDRDEVARFMAETATDAGAPGRDDRFGWGMVNVEWVSK